MMLFISIIVFCGLLFLACFLGTGTDAKNIKGFRNYPKALQEKLLATDKYKDQIKVEKEWKVFLNNTILYSLIVLVFGLFFKGETYLDFFVATWLLGNIANLFDLAVIDLLWFRNTKRIRFSEFPEKEDYKDVKNHYISFLKGVCMFTLIALVDGGILYAFAI